MDMRLFAYNKSVDEYNESALNHIQFDSIEFKAVDEGKDAYLISLKVNQIISYNCRRVVKHLQCYPSNQELK